MKKSEIYLKAAKIIDSGESEYSCHAIDLVVGYGHSKERYYFSLTFRKEGSDELYASDIMRNGGDPKEWRLTALCFAAAMAETGDI